MNVPRVAYLFFFLSSFLLHPVFAEETPFEARLTYAQGPVKLTTSDGKAKGTPLVYNPFSFEEGDFIRTGSSGTAEISFPGGTLVRLEPKSALRVGSLSGNTIELGLKSGVLLAKVHFEKAVGQQFRVVTPSAVAVVRGTEFVVEETGLQARVGVLDEGHVAVTAPGFKKEVVMHFNQETQVTHGLSPKDAQVLERLYHYKIEMADMRQRIKIIRKYWKPMTLIQRQRIRAAWIKKNSRSHRRSRLSDQ